MPKLIPLLTACFLAACGMKGDLVLPEAADPAGQPGQPAGNADEEAARRQGVNPPSADPDGGMP